MQELQRAAEVDAAERELVATGVVEAHEPPAGEPAHVSMPPPTMHCLAGGDTKVCGRNYNLNVF